MSPRTRNVAQDAELSRGVPGSPHTQCTAQASEAASTQGAGDVIMQRIELGPNGRTGWHTHPGPAIAIVQSGSLTILSGHDGACEAVTYGAGDSFVEILPTLGILTGIAAGVMAIAVWRFNKGRLFE